MLDHRLRRWSNIDPASDISLVLSGLELTISVDAVGDVISSSSRTEVYMPADWFSQATWLFHECLQYQMSEISVYIGNICYWGVFFIIWKIPLTMLLLYYSKIKKDGTYIASVYVQPFSILLYENKTLTIFVVKIAYIAIIPS